MSRPDWYGKRYPSLEDLVSFVESLGAYAHFDKFIPTALYVNDYPPILLMPERAGPLEAAWHISHEIGHLCQHGGPKGKLYWSKDEAQADRWAACALIPKARIEHYGNASVDAFIATLSANYEELPPHDCPERALAHKIAKIRLEMLAAKGG